MGSSNHSATMVEHGHLDRINDISFDSTGKRMATCSSDMCVKIWKKVNSDRDSVCSLNDTGISTTSGADTTNGGSLEKEKQPRWVNTHKIQAHNGPVWKVSWADPHFGQATSPWNLTVWVQHSKIKHLKNCTLTSISWSTPITLPTLLAVGANGGTLPDKTERFGLFELIHSANPDSGKELIWRRIQDPRIDIHSPTSVYEVAFAPSCGRRYHTLAVATDEIRVIKIELPFASQFQSSAGNESSDSLSNEASASKYIFSSQTVIGSAKNSPTDICYRLGWNALGTIFGASNGDGSVKLHKQNHFQQWVCFSRLETKVASDVTSRTSRSLFPTTHNNNQTHESVSLAGESKAANQKSNQPQRKTNYY